MLDGFFPIEPLIGGLRQNALFVSFNKFPIEPLIGGIDTQMTRVFSSTMMYAIEPLIGGLIHFVSTFILVPFWLLNPL